MTQVIVLTVEQAQALMATAVRREMGAIMREIARPASAFTTEEAAAYLKQSANTLKQWRGQSRGPAFTKGQGGVRYLKKDLDAWLEANRTLTLESPDAPHA